MTKGTIADSSKLKHTLVVEIEHSDPHYVYTSLKPLEREMCFSRGRISISISNSRVTVHGFAADLTSLRSLLNGILKSVYLLLAVEKMQQGSE